MNYTVKNLQLYSYHIMRNKMVRMEFYYGYVIVSYKNGEKAGQSAGNF